MPSFLHGPVFALPPIFSHHAGVAGPQSGDDHITHSAKASHGIDAIVAGTSTHMGPDLTAHYESLITGATAHGVEMGASTHHYTVSAKYEKHRHEMSHH